MNTITLNIDGYWIDKEYLPKYHGIYFVYRASNPHKNEKGEWVGTIEEILYIGKADDQTIFERHQAHEKQAEFDNALLEGEVLWYATAEVNDEINRVENGLIFKRQPRLNDVLTESFKYPDTHFVLHFKEDIADMFADFKLKKYDK